MASIKFRHGGVWKDASSYRFRHEGIWKTPSRIMARINGAWVQVWQALAVAVAGGFSQTSSGNNRYTDIGSFYVTRTPTTSPAPTAWTWELNDTGGQLSFFSGATSANFSCRGPQWQFGNFNPTFQADVRCTVTIEGKQYTTPWATFYYTGSGDL
jgi:hypothetical protein